MTSDQRHCAESTALSESGRQKHGGPGRAEGFRIRATARRVRLLLFLFVVLLLLGRGSAQVKFQVVHAFGAPGDGVGLLDGVVIDAEGNLYGTNGQGGAYNLGDVFELSSDESGGWTETLLYSFGTSGESDGSSPGGPVTIGSGGVLYGATTGGGTHNMGTLYSLTQGSTGWAEAILHSFNLYQDGVDGFSSNLALDVKGNLFGRGGTFEFSPGPKGWTLTPTCTWRRICGFNELNGTALGPGDRLFAAGTGGKYNVGDVYAVVPTPNGWQVGDLYDFRATQGDGQIPGFGPLVADHTGNIYGVTMQGGTQVCGNGGCGTVYKLTRQANGTWKETILYNFGPPATGFSPIGGVILDKAGNLYGTTGYGGPCDCGVVYRLSHNQNDTWTYTVLHEFSNFDGALPYSALTFDSHGNLFGTTLGGGAYGVGVVFEISRASEVANEP